MKSQEECLTCLLIKANKFSCIFQKYIYKSYWHNYLFTKGYQQLKPYSLPDTRIIKYQSTKYGLTLRLPVILMASLQCLTICTYRQPVAESVRFGSSRPSSNQTVSLSRTGHARRAYFCCSRNNWSYKTRLLNHTRLIILGSVSSILSWVTASSSFFWPPLRYLTLGNLVTFQVSFYLMMLEKIKSVNSPTETSKHTSLPL